ncbi:hypothetical protein DH2020_027298 [Rehmannia glutinosa]|uniref:Myb/SANT-like domain-containing protein n=1 Tax=Rehmannia glutinosa TaxID=99300 RepID=A0ABR0VVH6_REHGL
MNRKGKSRVSSGMTDGKEDRAPRSRRDDDSWDMSTVGTLLELMYEQFQQGQLLSSTFSDQIWKVIRKELTERHNVDYSVVQLKGKACRLRILWRKFHDLITKKTGFGWDPLIFGQNRTEEYWASWIAENPEEAYLKKRGLPFYDRCTEMFSNSVATGEFARSSANYPLDSDEEEDLNTLNRGVSKSQGPVDDISVGLGTPTSLNPEDNLQNSAGRRASEKRGCKRDRSSRIDACIDSMEAINSAHAQKLSTPKM